MALVLVPEAVVAGYWSDGSANVEATASVINEGGLRLDRPVDIAVTCSRNGEAVDGCADRMSLSLPDGYGPASSTVTLRAPTGDLSLKFAYGEDESTTLSIDVPERIVGVDRGVWTCFSDTPRSTPLTPEELVGCGAWHSETVQKYDQASRVKVWGSGPEGFIEVFKGRLDYLEPVLGLAFEWVSAEAEADVVVEISHTLEEEFHHCPPGAAACASVGAANEMGEMGRNSILIKNTWGESAFQDLPKTSQNFLESAMTHELIHSLSSMVHRTEPDSIMNITGFRRLKPSPMDERLLMIHGHPLVKPGMAMAEIEVLIVFNDELIDPRLDVELTKWRLVSNAYRVLREAESATFRVRSSMPSCNEELGWADYTLFDLESHRFAWVGIDDGSEGMYVYRGSRGATEYWRRAPGGWLEVTSQAYAEAMPGWNSYLTDPHAMLQSVLQYADWKDAGLVIGPDGLATLRFAMDTEWSGHLAAVIVLNPELGTISQYSMDWEGENHVCGGYSVEARDGRYSDAFEFPDAVSQGSGVLGDCAIERLGPISGAVSRSSTWGRHCGNPPYGYSRSYSFSVDDWSYVRAEITSANRASLRLSPGNTSAEKSVDKHTQFIHTDDYGLIWYTWAQSIVPPGEYVLEVVTHDRVIETFDLAIGVSETHPPPHSFEAISSGGRHVCALDADGVAVCWGSNDFIPPRDEVAILPPPDERFMAIASGRYHACGLRPDGEAVCWGTSVGGTLTPPPGEKFASISSSVGSHICALRLDGTAVCWGSNYKGEGSPPPGEHFAYISNGGNHTCALREDGSAVCWGANNADQSSPPPGERFASISSGGAHTCALRMDGSATCWGYDNRGQSSPPEGERFTSISSGFRHTCGLRPDGSAVCWGRHSEGQTSSPANERFISISSGRDHTCGLRSDGTPICWGSDYNGQPSSPFPQALAPAQTVAPEKFVSVTSGRHGTCALRSDAVVECWDKDRQPIPVPLERYSSISSGAYHTCALRENGSVFCWGNDDYNQLVEFRYGGWATRTDLASLSSGGFHTCFLRVDGGAECEPSIVGSKYPGGGSYAAISSGGFHTCALRPNGSPECWGHNGFGQGSPPTRERFASISSGWRHTCALRENGSAVCWGANEDVIDFGQVSPPTNERFAAISSGAWHTCALRGDGSAVCWGADEDAVDFGQASPPAGERFVSISCGEEHTCGVTVDGTLICWGNNPFTAQPS